MATINKTNKELKTAQPENNHPVDKAEAEDNTQADEAEFENTIFLNNQPVAFSEPVERLIDAYQNYFTSKLNQTEVATLNVDEIASKVALFYERFRKIVDWKEEHLVRRGAIERILKRKLISEISGFNLANDLKPQEITEPFVLELIRGGHFNNNEIPRAKLTEITNILSKYIYIIENNPLVKEKKATSKIKKKINIYNWIIEIAACEIEETLEPPIRELALINCMTESMLERIKIHPHGAISENDKIIQVYIAVHRTLFHLDEPYITYHLIKFRYPEWSQLTEDSSVNVSRRLFEIKEIIQKDLDYPHSNYFFNLCEKYDTLYLLLGDALNKFRKKPNQIRPTLIQPEKLIHLIKNAYQKRLSTLKKRLFRAAIYSTLSIFIASAFSLYILEVPLAKLFYGHFRPLAIAVDILIPTALMFILVSLVKPPKKGNLGHILKKIQKVAYRQDEKDVFEIRLKQKRNIILKILIGILYALGTAVSLGFVFWIFSIAGVPATSLYIDTLNVAMIVFAALVIKQRAKELTVEEKPTFWEFSIDILSVPMAKIGQWLSEKWKEYNIVSVFFIALVDLPFSKLIKFIEAWSSFLKEKKAEIH